MFGAIESDTCRNIDIKHIEKKPCIVEIPVRQYKFIIVSTMKVQLWTMFPKGFMQPKILVSNFVNVVLFY